MLHVESVQDTLTAKAFYCGDDKVGEATRMVTRMSGGYAGATGGGGPGSSPPDLPSLLLDARICYIGMPVSRGPVGRVITHQVVLPGLCSHDCCQAIPTHAAPLPGPAVD